MLRLNLACLAVGSTEFVLYLRDDPVPPQSSLFGCRFDEELRSITGHASTPPQSSLFGCRFDDNPLS